MWNQGSLEFRAQGHRGAGLSFQNSELTQGMWEFDPQRVQEPQDTRGAGKCKRKLNGRFCEQRFLKGEVGNSSETAGGAGEC